MQETWVQSLSLEGALEEGMATHSNIVCCLGKPRHRGAWQVTVHGVTQSPTQLQQLSTSHSPLREQQLKVSVPS